MLKHIRQALKIAGVKAGDIEVIRKPGHVVLQFKGRRIFCSTSPKDRDGAAKAIAKELTE